MWIRVFLLGIRSCITRLNFSYLMIFSHNSHRLQEGSGCRLARNSVAAANWGAGHLHRQVWEGEVPDERGTGGAQARVVDEVPDAVSAMASCPSPTSRLSVSTAGPYLRLELLSSILSLSDRVMVRTMMGSLMDSKKSQQHAGMEALQVLFLHILISFFYSSSDFSMYS